MRTYTKTWIGTAAGLLAVGAVSSLLFDTGTALIMLALGLVTGAAIGIVAERGHVTAWAGWGALVTVGAAGLAHADVTIFAGVALMFAALSPPVVGLVTRATAGHGGPPARSRRGHLLWPVPLSAADAEHDSADLRQRENAMLQVHDEHSLRAMADQLRTLSDLELCRAWRRSFLVLDAAASPVIRLAVVQLRQAYLDELGRRRPDALQAWFDAGGRAASGPDRFFLDAS